MKPKYWSDNWIVDMNSLQESHYRCIDQWELHWYNDNYEQECTAHRAGGHVPPMWGATGWKCLLIWENFVKIWENLEKILENWINSVIF